MRARAGVAAVWLLVTLAGCTFEPPPEDPVSTTVPRELQPSVPEGIQELPLHKLVITDVEKSRFYRAVGRKTNDCLENSGGKPVFKTAAGEVAPFVTTGRLGVMTQERATKHGYGLTRAEQRGLDGVLPGDLTAYRRDDSITDDVKELIDGADGNSGCLAKGAAAVVDQVPGAPTGTVVQQVLADPLLMSLIQQADASAVQDAALSQALAGWRDCMAAVGYAVGHPNTVVQDLNLNPKIGTNAGAEPDEAEKAVALADVQCKDETKLVLAWNSAVFAEQEKLLAEYSEPLGIVASVKKLYVDGAQAVLGDD